jgi:hypothetical protein
VAQKWPKWEGWIFSAFPFFYNQEKKMKNKTVRLDADRLGDVFNHKVIMGYDMWDTYSTIMKIEKDPKTGARKYHQVEFMGFNEFTGPISKDDFNDFLDPGKYVIRVFDTETKEFLGSITVTNEGQPDQGTPITQQNEPNVVDKMTARISQIEIRLGRIESDINLMKAQITLNKISFGLAK